MPAPYPGGSDRVTVEAFLKLPVLISRRLTDIAKKRLVADKIFSKGSPDQLGAGIVLYQESETIYPDRDPDEVTPRSGFIRTGVSEQLQSAYVHEYGLEFVVSDTLKRRQGFDVLRRGQLKIANGLIKLIDTKAMTLLTTSTKVQTFAASGDWTTAATDIIADIAKAKKMIYDKDEGYDPDTLIVNPAQELDLITDKDIRDALPRENGGSSAVITGAAVPILGLKQILVTPQLAAGTVLVVSSGITGSIADEQPTPDEGYVADNTGNTGSPVLVKIYRPGNERETVVRGYRAPAMWLPEPASSVKITAA